MTLLTVNMKQLNKFRVYSDNVIAYDQIIQSKGKFYTDQPDIYTRWLDEYGIFYTMKGAARNNLPGRALQPRKKNPAKRLQQGDNVRFSPAVVKRTGGFAGDMRGFIVSIHPSGKTASVDTHGTWQSEDGQSIRGIPLANLVHDSTRRANPAKRRPTIAGPASAARGEKLWKAAFEGKTYKGYRIVFYDMQNLYGISAHGTHLSYAPTISAAEKIIDQLDPIDAHLKKNPAKRRKANPIKKNHHPAILIEIDRGNGWEFYTRFESSNNHARAIKQMALDAAKHAAKMQPSWRIRVVNE